MKIKFDFRNSHFLIEETWRSMNYDKCFDRAPSVLFVMRERWTSGISSTCGCFLKGLIRRALC